MRNVVAALLGTALCGFGLTAQGQNRVPAAPKMAVSHRSTSLGTAPSAALGAGVAVDAQTNLVRQYCTACHNERMKAGGMSLASFDAATVADHADLTEKMIRKLRAGMMPPPGMKRPDDSTIDALAEAFETALDAAAAARPDPGSRPFQRMNRAEYARSIRDLLAIDVDVTAFLPADTISDGFDNITDQQAFSPVLLEGYLRAASQISRLAVGDRSASAGSTTYKLGRAKSQMQRVEGAPIGTRGGISVVHVFPADGDYVFKMNLHNEPLGGLYGRSTMTAMSLKEKVEVSINGQRVALLDLNTRMSESDPANSLDLVTPPIHVQAGPQRVAAAFVQNLEAPPDDLLMPTENSLVDVSMSYGVTLLPHMRDLTVVGPSRVTGVSDTVSRRKVFTCRPTSAAEEAPCAEQIVRRLAGQAYRGRVTDQDVRELMTFYERGRQQSDFENGVRLALQAMLASPRFLFRTEQAPQTLRAGEAYRVVDQDLATRLSFFLWGTVPDAELLKAVRTGSLRTGAGLDRQVRRMLADPRSEALATRFAAQWLRLQDLEKIVPDYLHYPHYDGSLAESMKRETELFFHSVVREDRSVLDLLTADYSFVNERLARHYGIPNIVGADFRRVQLPENRRGILGHGSILTLTSVADRTSPVLRGKWIMEVLLGTPPPPPPPNVPDLEETSGIKGARLLSVRERMEEHRRNPACTSCHKVIDPLGLALENYDPTGAWRIKDNEMPVDPTGDLYDGTKLNGPADLRAALLKRHQVILLSFTENLMTYAIGRRVEYHDMPAVRTVVRDAARNNNRMSALILGVVNSAPFRMNKAGEDLTTASARPRPRRFAASARQGVR
jgi:cytochrome c551/c552